MDKIRIAGGIEIGNAYSFDPSVAMRFFHGPVHILRFRVGFVDQQQINVLQPQGSQRHFDGTFCQRIAGVGAVQFCSDEQLLTRDEAFLESTAQLFFIAVHLSRIKQAVSQFNGIQYSVFTFFSMKGVNTKS